MNGKERRTHRRKGAQKSVETDKHKLADLVRYLARRAAERDYEAMQNTPRKTDGKAVKP